MSVINQKEYLKKYLSIGKAPSEKKKKKRKKIRNETCGLKIIDDNVDTFKTAVQEDLLGETEDAPQIVEIIDDRPPSLQVDEKSNMHLWIPIGGDNGTSIPASSSSVSTKFISMNKNLKSRHGDMSPPRRNNKDADISPPRRNKRTEEISLLKNNKRYKDLTQLLSNRKDDDISPLRKNSQDEDISPPRRNKKGEDMSLLITNRRSEEIYQFSKDRKDDISPPRRKKTAEDMSPPRRLKVNLSSPKNIKTKEAGSPHANTRYNGEEPLPIKNKENSDKRKESRWDSSYSKSPKMMKTLDGKTAGLQNARELGEETRKIKRKEEELFNNLSSEVSGVNASTIVRDKKTGKIRNLAEEAEKDLEKLKKKAESEEKYSRWGKGLKQVEDDAARRSDAINEMNKPLARYADDEDLERYLKEQEREGDPMLAYIRKKKKRQDVDEGKPIKPEYMGEFMPNRFGIRPGHRWDGVDRSNGYEKKWFEVQNSRLAQREETYKWSTEDM